MKNTHEATMKIKYSSSTNVLDVIREKLFDEVVKEREKRAIELLRSIGIKTTKPRYVKAWLTRKGYAMVIEQVEQIPKKIGDNPYRYEWKQYLVKRSVVKYG